MKDFAIASALMFALMYPNAARSAPSAEVFKVGTTHDSKYCEVSVKMSADKKSAVVSRFPTHDSIAKLALKGSPTAEKRNYYGKILGAEPAHLVVKGPSGRPVLYRYWFQKKVHSCQIVL